MYTTTKKMSVATLVAVLAFSLVACNQSQDTKAAQNSTDTAQSSQDDSKTSGEKLTIKTATGDQSIVANPNPIAVYDMTARCLWLMILG